MGLPVGDVDFLNADGPTTHALLMRAQPRMTQFTGSSRVAESLARDLHGRIKIEDAGFDWKILGPDVSNVEYVSWVSDQDAYACSGQKCSAQSMLFAHRNWVRKGFFDRIAGLASRRSLTDCTIGPVLTWTTERMKEHVGKLLTIPGARVLFGGEELPHHTIPACYGALQPTAVFVPLAQMAKARYFGLATTEVFGPVQVVTEYTNRDVHKVVDICNRMTAHLTAAVVSNDDAFRCAAPPPQRAPPSHTLPGTHTRTHMHTPTRTRHVQQLHPGQHHQRHHVRGHPCAHNRGATEPLVWPLGRPAVCRHWHAGGHPARVELTP